MASTNYHQVSIHLTEAQHQALRLKVVLEGGNQSQIIRELIDAYLLDDDDRELMASMSRHPAGRRSKDKQ